MEWLFEDFMMRHSISVDDIESYRKIDNITIEVRTKDGRIYVHVSTKPCPTTYKFLNERVMYLYHYPEDEADWLLAFKRQLDWAIAHHFYGISYVAELSGLSEPALSNYTSHFTKRVPSVYLLMRIAVSIKCSVSEFIKMFCFKPPVLENGDVIPTSIQPENEWRYEFAKRLDRLMYDYGITQQETAKFMNVSQGTISNYLNARSSPSVQAIYRLARALNLTTQELSDLLGYV